MEETRNECGAKYGASRSQFAIPGLTGAVEGWSNENERSTPSKHYICSPLGISVQRLQ